MADPCSTLVQSLALLRQQRDQLTASLASSGNSIAIHKQLQGIAAGIVTLNALLKECRANSAHPETSAFMLAEHNQAVQMFDVPYYAYPVVGQIPPSNNMVPMVSRRPTMVRLYVDAPSGARLTGTLQLQKPSGPVSVAPLSGSIVGRAINAIDRLQLTHTLNFAIPPEHCEGSYAYVAAVSDASTGAMLGGRNFALSFVDVPPVKVHCVLIHYTGLDYNDAPVNKTVDLSDVLTVLVGVLAAYPISDLDFDGCEILEWDEQMKYDSGWEDLLDTVADMRDQSGSDAIYLGFVPEEANCGGVCGKGRLGGGACVFRAGDTMDPLFNAVHEMGHAVGRKHAPECLPDGEEGDTSYPQYGPLLPRTSIGGIGLDMRDLSPTGLASAIQDPMFVRDYMSYCDTVWTSPYGYLFAMDRFRSGDFTDAPPGAKRRELYLSMANCCFTHNSWG